MATIKKYTKKDGSTAYMFQAYLGTDPNTGSRIRVTRQGFSTKKEASLAISRLKVEADEGSFISIHLKPGNCQGCFFFRGEALPSYPDAAASVGIRS